MLYFVGCNKLDSGKTCQLFCAAQLCSETINDHIVIVRSSRSILYEGYGNGPGTSSNGPGLRYTIIQDNLVLQCGPKVVPRGNDTELGAPCKKADVRNAVGANR